MFQQHGKMLPIQASHLLHVIAYVEEKHSDELFTISLTSTTRDCDNCQFKGQNIMFNLFFYPALVLKIPLKLFCGIFFVALKLLLEVNRTGSTKAATGRKADG